MARDQRTRLNAELAHQYNGSRKVGAEASPGRNALGELVEKQDAAPDGVEVEEQEQELEEQEQELEAEPKKSLFELPRKEPSRQPLLASPFGPQPAAPAASAAPAAPAAPSSTTPKPPRRG